MKRILILIKQFILILNLTKSKKHKIIYFNRIEIYDNNDTHCIFIIDELSKKYTKDSKQDKAILFLVATIKKT